MIGLCWSTSIIIVYRIHEFCLPVPTVITTCPTMKTAELKTQGMINLQFGCLNLSNFQVFSNLASFGSFVTRGLGPRQWVDTQFGANFLFPLWFVSNRFPKRILLKQFEIILSTTSMIKSIDLLLKPGVPPFTRETSSSLRFFSKVPGANSMMSSPPNHRLRTF